MAEEGPIHMLNLVRLMLIVPEDERRDRRFIAEYPSGAAFVAMVKDPACQKAVVRRQAAALAPRLIRLNPLKRGQGFADSIYGAVS